MLPDENPKKGKGRGKGKEGKSSKSPSFRSAWQKFNNAGRTPPWSTGFDSISEDSPSDSSWSVISSAAPSPPPGTWASPTTTARGEEDQPPGRKTSFSDL
eukprot:4737866-Pyramimonas_sp.AAC.1